MVSFCIFLFQSGLYAQMVIGGSTPSAILDLQSTSKGLLPPRMTTAQRDAITAPAKGLIVFNTDLEDLQVNLGTPSAPSSQRLTASMTLATQSTPMVSLPAGTFSMGCTTGDPNCDSDESPVRSVTLSAFQIGETEVTQRQWLSVMGANPSYFASPVCPQCPVELVSWYDAVVFCNRLSELQGRRPCYYSDAGYTQVYGKSGGTWSLPNSGTVYWNPAAKGYRLPTEAEWEYAARGGSATNVYSGSSTVDNVGWYFTNSGGRTKAVKGLFRNGYGLYDMSGNVGEWCWDRYGTYPNSAQTNPTGPSTASYRVYRGGGWFDNARNCRVSNRNYGGTPSFHLTDLGFRLAL
jgi:formylglycine-generating enzyme required for sulfatase activity